MLLGLWHSPEFSEPHWLWLSLLLPAVWIVSARSLVDRPRRQQIASTVIRTFIAALLVLAAGRITVMESGRQVFAVFLVDESLSIDAEEGDARTKEFISNATARIADDRWKVIRFASTPVAPDAGEEVKTWRLATDISSALQLAQATVPSEAVPHLVLLSDGNETRGDAVAALTKLNARVSTVLLPGRTEPEIQVSEVRTPGQVAEGEPFEVAVVVDSNHDDSAVIEVYNGDFRVISESKKIKAGENVFRFTQQTSAATEISARIRRSQDADNASFSDTIVDNNRAAGLVFTQGKPKVLVIDRIPRQARNLEWAMQEEGIIVETRPPSGLPQTLSELQRFDILILSSVPAPDLSADQMDMIRRYVSDLGGGLVMLGSDNSFGLGGYYGTVIDDVLPVHSNFQKEKEKPGLGMVLVIDKSGSMGGQKIALAREAARAAVELLSPKDFIGVIAFDGSSFWVSEMRPASQKTAVMDRIASIEAGGGTTMYPALEEAFRALQSTESRLKHVIILSDGYSTPGDFEGLTQQMAAAHMTVSTVGIGDADQAMLEQIARLGDGRYYFSKDPSSIPQIFARETMTAGKSAIQEEPFLPIQVRATPVLQDVDFDEAPFLLGHVMTRPKATGEIILTTEQGDPLLAWWRYGLGMSVAFTSDAQSRWAAEWLTWEGFNRFWAQIIRHCMRRSDMKNFNLQIKHSDGVCHVSIDSLHPDGEFVNGARTVLSLICDNHSTETIPVKQTGPGRYEARFPTPANSRSWQMQITQSLNNSTMFQQSRGFVSGYNAEYRMKPDNAELLQNVAQQSGGTWKVDPKDVFQPADRESTPSVTELWPALLVAAMLIFGIDVAVRRLDFSLLLGS